jgi:hypothetical protein
MEWVHGTHHRSGESNDGSRIVVNPRGLSGHDVSSMHPIVDLQELRPTGTMSRLPGLFVYSSRLWLSWVLQVPILHSPLSRESISLYENGAMNAKMEDQLTYKTSRLLVDWRKGKQQKSSSRCNQIIDLTIAFPPYPFSTNQCHKYKLKLCEKEGLPKIA